MPAVNETFEELNSAAELWLKNISKHFERAIDVKYTKHYHERFFRFDPMGHCNDLSCIGGSCSADASKIMCCLSHY